MNNYVARCSYKNETIKWLYDTVVVARPMQWIAEFTLNDDSGSGYDGEKFYIEGPLN